MIQPGESAFSFSLIRSQLSQFRVKIFFESIFATSRNASPRRSRDSRSAGELILSKLFCAFITFKMKFSKNSPITGSEVYFALQVFVLRTFGQPYFVGRYPDAWSFPGEAVKAAPQQEHHISPEKILTFFCFELLPGVFRYLAFESSIF